VKLIPRKPINADDNVGRGMDLALVTLVFLAIGYGLDRWMGTKPVFMISLVILALVGQFISMWYRYDATMTTLEDQRAAAGHQHQVQQRANRQARRDDALRDTA
jgi:F0F1-type ATP synthase assembly protein I